MAVAIVLNFNKMRRKTMAKSPTRDAAITSSELQESDHAQNLSPRVSKQLLAYTAVAVAAVGASASRADAEVVYTPVHDHFNFVYPLDLNHDGIDDFNLLNYELSGAGFVEVFPQVVGNKIVATHQRCDQLYDAAAALKLGAVIGPGYKFLARANCMANLLYAYPSYGPWVDTFNHYLGFAFEIDGKTALWLGTDQCSSKLSRAFDHWLCLRDDSRKSDRCRRHWRVDRRYGRTRSRNASAWSGRIEFLAGARR